MADFDDARLMIMFQGGEQLGVAKIMALKGWLADPLMLACDKFWLLETMTDMIIELFEQHVRFAKISDSTLICRVRFVRQAAMI